MQYYAADMVMMNSRCNCCALLSANKFSVTLKRLCIETEKMSVLNKIFENVFRKSRRRYLLY